MWNETKVIPSSDDNVFKFVFSQDDAVAEAVLYRYPNFKERTVICCSTQSGCPMGCRFCGSGDYFVRNLTDEEIVEQVKAAVEYTEENPDEIQKFQIMFMSMGEPMLNFKNLKKALRTLHGLYPNADLLISTSGPNVPKSFKKLNELSVEIPKIGLQFSVHESTDKARNNLIPFKDKMDLHDMGVAGRNWALHTGRKPYFNYCVHEDNNKENDVARLTLNFPSYMWECTLSVICERDEHVKSSVDRQLKIINNFSELMLQYLYNVRIFNPAGQDDVGGGCGQLFHVQSWMKDHPDRARPSIGNDNQKVHTPK